VKCIGRGDLCRRRGDTIEKSEKEGPWNVPVNRNGAEVRFQGLGSTTFLESLEKKKETLSPKRKEYRKGMRGKWRRRGCRRFFTVSWQGQRGHLLEKSFLVVWETPGEEGTNGRKGNLHMTVTARKKPIWTGARQHQWSKRNRIGRKTPGRRRFRRKGSDRNERHIKGDPA